ncbi:MAG: ATP-binding protein [Bdellovibrionaceae bacterium]|nr:ATP-binding protein [Bdellovibrionales bacterium]MCB9083986.1 ATP-binding protein [Pseudobdellovibrionaceae bacterium]
MAHAFIHLTNNFVPNADVRLRLAIVGAPGSGKSTLAAGLLYFSKLFFFRTDAVPEVAKWHYYKGSDFKAPDFEIKKFWEQKELEEIYPDELNILICEAPLIMSAIYSSYYLGDDSPVAQELFQLADKHKDRYTHYILSRKLVRFEEFGRNESQEQADSLHHKTVETLERLGLNYIVVNRYDDHIPLQILSMVGAVSPEREVEKGKGLAFEAPHLDV